MQTYPRQAKDTEMIDRATEIRLRAERRAGELDKNRGAASGGVKESPRGKPRDETPTLADLGVTKTQSSRWQKWAEIATIANRARRALETKRPAEEQTRRPDWGPHEKRPRSVLRGGSKT